MTDPKDERFDAFLHRTASGYNEPPATPRDEMWAAISTARRERSFELANRRRTLRWAAGLAAVLAAGIGLGRMSVTDEGTVVIAADSGVEAPAATYRAVAGDHLGRVETLLTMFRAEARSGRRGGYVSEAARGLLSTNRLLLDSPAANDRRMKDLLEDLDLVLAQIAQLSAERGMDPTEMIVRALEDNGVLFRLRSAAPAGRTMMSTQGAL